MESPDSTPVREVPTESLPFFEQPLVVVSRTPEYVAGRFGKYLQGYRYRFKTKEGIQFEALIHKKDNLYAALAALEVMGKFKAFSFTRDERDSSGRRVIVNPALME